MNQFPDVLTPKEVAAVLRVSVRHVQNEAVSLGGFKVGNQWRFNADRIRAFIQGPMASDVPSQDADAREPQAFDDPCSRYAALLSGKPIQTETHLCN